MTDDRSTNITNAATLSTISFPGEEENNNHHSETQIKECAREHVFLVAKFLRLEDLPCADKKICGAARWHNGAPFKTV